MDPKGQLDSEWIWGHCFSQNGHQKLFGFLPYQRNKDFNTFSVIFWWVNTVFLNTILVYLLGQKSL